MPAVGMFDIVLLLRLLGAFTFLGRKLDERQVQGNGVGEEAAINTTRLRSLLSRPEMIIHNNMMFYKTLYSSSAFDARLSLP